MKRARFSPGAGPCQDEMTLCENLPSEEVDASTPRAGWLSLCFALSQRCPHTEPSTVFQRGDQLA